MESVLCEQLVK